LLRKAVAPAFSAVERTKGSSFAVKMTTRWKVNLVKPRLNLKAAHLRHENVNQGNPRAMNPRIIQELLGIAKRFCVQPS
jgi:hypothetical protein